MALYRLTHPHLDSTGKLIPAGTVRDFTHEQAFSKGADGKEYFSPYLIPIDGAPSGPTSGPAVDAGSRATSHAEARDHPDFMGHTLASQSDVQQAPSLPDRVAALEARVAEIGNALMPADPAAFAAAITEGVKARLVQLLPKLAEPPLSPPAPSAEPAPEPVSEPGAPEPVSEPPAQLLDREAGEQRAVEDAYMRKSGSGM